MQDNAVKCILKRGVVTHLQDWHIIVKKEWKILKLRKYEKNY